MQYFSLCVCIRCSLRVVSPTCVPNAAVVEGAGAVGSGDSLPPPATDGGAADTDVGSLPPPSTSPPQDLASRCAFIRSLPTFSDVRTVCHCPAFVLPVLRLLLVFFLFFPYAYVSLHNLHKSTGYPEVQDRVWEGEMMGEFCLA
jgi:hypothetical protein